ncbi:lamin tail domain-containing protein [Brevifollis gellanilyticus]|nr:lamin tail domain-containing protein [Brevifollis gellanilyticus]
MKVLRASLSFATLLLFQVLAQGTAHAGAFTAGNIAVLQADASANNTTASVIELHPSNAAQTPSNTITILGTGASALRFSGSATSTGYVANSADGSRLVFTGANNTDTSANVNTLNPRGVGVLDPAGAFTLPATYTGTSGNQTRCATSLNNTAWWIADQGGAYASGATTASPSGNFRGMKAFGSAVYVGQASGTGTVIQVSTLSAITGGTVTGLPGLANNANLQDFYLISSGSNGTTYDVLYTLSATSNTAGTIAKYSLVSGSWTANGTYTTTFGGFGLAAADNGAGAVLYVTTGQGALTANSVLRINDTAGHNSTLNITTGNNVTLYTAPAAKIVKGVAFAPVAPVVPQAQLILTEINSNAAGGDFWELTNVGNAAQDMSNWKWIDGGQSLPAPAAQTFAPGSSIAAGETVVIITDTTDSTAFLGTWGSLPGIQKLVGGPGLGQNDSVRLYDNNDNLIFTFTYGAGGFTQSGGSAAAGGHAGVSAGGVAAQSAVIDPAFGTGAGRRYRGATVGVDGGYANTSGGSNIGSPGVTGISTSGGPSITLTLSATPNAFSESATNPASTGTVTRTGATTAALVVNLSSSDTTEATVPASVTIPIGSASTTFNITAVNDSFPDGNKTVTLTASATDATAGTTTLTVQDDGDVAQNNLMLTEVLSQQAASGVSDFWELTNISGSAVSLAGYSWHDSGHSASTAATYALPPGSSIAPGESVIFTTISPSAFRTWWGISNAVQVFQTTGAPGLGQDDGVSFFDEGGNEIFFFNYAAGGFTKADGSASTGTHSGPSAGAATETQSAVWVPSSGTTTPRYTFATVNNLGCFASAANAADIGSPGVTSGNPMVSIGDASILEGNSGTSTLALTVTRSDTATAFTVNYAVTGGTATSGTDYATLANGTLTFTAGGAATQAINITVNGDTASEPDETIIVTLSNVVNTTGTTVISNATGTGTITNDDTIAPQITTQPAGTTIASGFSTTLSLAATGTPAPSVQWYQGSTGVTTTPVGTNSSSFTTPALTTTTSYWARVSNVGGSVDSSTATVTITAGVSSVNLANYVRVGRYNLPEYRRTALPPGTASHNVLCDEASGVAYNWDTDTLFICGDGGRAITQVTKTGQLVDTMSMELNAPKPQGTEFYDPEGITYIGGGQFVFSEERERRLVKFTYVAGTTLTRAATQTVDIGTFDDNTGTEGLSYDPQTSGALPGFIVLKEKTPIGVFQTNVDFAAGTATNGSPTTTNSTNLFDTTLLGMTDVADVFAFSNIPSMVGQPQAGNMLIIGQENARILNVDRAGNILSTLNITSDPGNPLSAGDQQHEGITMDRAGNIYVVNENGGGSTEYPQLWVYAPSSAQNQAPTAITLNNAVNSILENTSTASPIKIGDIIVTDDGLGTNALSLTGADVAAFEITGTSLYLKAGIVLDYETKTSYAVTINVDDTTVGTNPDATLNVTLTVTDQAVETPPVPALIVTEVSPWSSTVANSPLGADWFEVTNVSAAAVNITGWKVDDSSPAFATAVALNGITSIAPGESVIFVEGTATTATSFKTNWFGASPPAALQVGSYTGSGIGLSTSGDAVNLYTAAGVLHSGVNFGAADASSPWQTFDNTLAQYNTAISLLSVVGVNGAFTAANSPNEVGSPGDSAPGVLRITEVAPWSSGSSPVAKDWFEVTNIGARAVDVTGWKVDDSTESFAAAVPTSGITSIAPGETVIYIETSTLAATKATFLSNWFGANPPATLQVGGYSGADIGLSTGGDAVNLYDTNNVRHASLSFGVATSTAPYRSFDNAAAANVTSVTTLSSTGVNGAFVAANSPNEIGSPGVISGGQTGFAVWLAQNGYTGSQGGDTDNDGIPDELEYFFSTNPNSGGDRSGLPQVAMNGSDLEFTFTYLTNTAFSGFVQSSENLVNWGNATAGIDYEVVSQTVNGAETTVRFRLFSNPNPTTQGPFTYLTPFTAKVDRGTIGSLTITNLGMVGAGRLTGSQLDGFGETMGASSGLSITNWGYNSGSGQFTGTFNVLPDRGYNSGAIFSNYAARVHSVPFTFTPYYGTAAVAQNQIVPTYSTTMKFTYLDGATTKFTTGLNPTGVSTIMGQSVGTVVAANGPGGAQTALISFDAEAIHVFPDGSGFVSDEYGTYIGRFNSSKQITRLIQLPESARPHRPVGTLEFDSVNPPTNGRRNNQGLEGMAVSPDNTRLLALMQSALVQDTGAGGQGRFNTRLYVYDIVGANLENPVLIAEHAVQLPRYDLNGNGSGLDTTSAQSEIVALSNTQFLMLPRDGNGLGKGTTDPIVMKTVDLVDFSSATNILGLHDAEGAQISPAGTLRSGITPAKSTVVVNLLSSTDLAKFGFNTNTSAPNQFTVNEKMEGMSLVPDLSTASTEDYFLFLGNDNDFQSSDVRMVDASGALVSYGDARDRGITNDAVFTAWRIIITPNNHKFFRVNVNP